MRRRSRRVVLSLLLAALGASPHPAAEAKPVYIVYERDSVMHEITIQGIRSKVPGVQLLQLDAVQNLPDCDRELQAVVAVGKPALETLVNYCRETPIIFVLVSGPRFDGYKKYANVTGVTFDVSMRQLFQELSRILKPGAKIGFVYSTEINHYLASETEFLEGEFEFNILRRRVADRSQLSAALKYLVEEEQISALWILPDAIFNAAIFQKISEICRVKKVLLISNFEALVKDAGAALALAPDLFGAGAQGGEVLQMVLKGAKPDSIPYRSPKNTGVYLKQAIFDEFGIPLPNDLKFREKVTSLNERGQKAYQAGKTNEALNLFREALTYDAGNTVARYYIDSIRSQNAYNIALTFLEKGDRKGALPYLVQAAPFHAEARAKLANTRADMQKYVGSIFQAGVQEFEQKKFQACLNTMNLVLMIDPGYEMAKLYRDKANRRAKALKQLR